MDFLSFVPVWVKEPGADRKHRLSMDEREARLRREGEWWIAADGLAEVMREGWRPVELIWHGEDGSRREPWPGGK